MMDGTIGMTDVFVPYGKTSRLEPDKTFGIIVTEKMDGSNCGITIRDSSIVSVQSRNRFIYPNSEGVTLDNFGFASWVRDNEEELLEMGDGKHFGEWAGVGINKNPHKLDTKEWFLFDTSRPTDTLPDCVNQVPILYQGLFGGTNQLDQIMFDLKNRSRAEGRKAEGIIVYWRGFRKLQKYTFNNNKSKYECQT